MGPGAGAVRAPRPPAALVSPHRAENELGMRHGSMADLIRQGRVRWVPWLGNPGRGRVRIPRSEVERIAREGLTPTGRQPRARKARGPGVIDPDALLRLDLRTL